MLERLKKYESRQVSAVNLVLRSATTWPSGLLFVLVMFSLSSTLEMTQDDAVTSGNNVFFVLFELCMWTAK